MARSERVTLPIGVANPLTPVTVAVAVTGSLHRGPKVPMLWPLPKVMATVGEARTVSEVACVEHQSSVTWACSSCS